MSRQFVLKAKDIYVLDSISQADVERFARFRPELSIFEHRLAGTLLCGNCRTSSLRTTCDPYGVLKTQTAFHLNRRGSPKTCFLRRTRTPPPLCLPDPLEVAKGGGLSPGIPRSTKTLGKHQLLRQQQGRWNTHTHTHAHTHTQPPQVEVGKMWWQRRARQTFSDLGLGTNASPDCSFKGCIGTGHAT